MYNSQPMPSTMPEHQSVAIDFANAMLERFPPFICNEILSTIRQRWNDNWQMEAAAAQQKATEYNEALSALNANNQFDKAVRKQ